MRDNEIFRSMMKIFGIKNALEIKFESEKKVKVEYDNNREETIERVDSLMIMEMSDGGASLDINYLTETGDGSTSTTLKNYKSITILD